MTVEKTTKSKLEKILNNCRTVAELDPYAAIMFIGGIAFSGVGVTKLFTEHDPKYLLLALGGPAIMGLASYMSNISLKAYDHVRKHCDIHGLSKDILAYQPLYRKELAKYAKDTNRREEYESMLKRLNKKV